MSSGLDEFYKDAANSFIPVVHGFKIVLMKFNGEKASYIEAVSESLCAIWYKETAELKN